MHITIPRENLLAPLQWVNGVVQKKQTMPILSHVLLNAGDHHITMVGTDTEVQLKGIVELPQSAAQHGQVTVPSRKLLDICRSLPEESVLDLHYSKDTVYLRSGNSRFALATMNHEEFPTFHHDEQGFKLNLSQNQLRELLHRTSFAMAEEDVRHYLNGLLLEVEGRTIRAVATDGHRLAYDELTLTEPAPDNARIIIPYKAVSELSKALRDDDSPVECHITSTTIGVETDRFEFSSRLIDARYPDYRRVIPEVSDTVFNLERLPFKQAISRAAIMCPEKSRVIQLRLRENYLTVYANNGTQEEAEEVINMDYSGPDLDIGFNVNYLLDVLNVLQDERVQITVAENHNGILIQEPEDSNALYVVMAMQV